MSPCHPFLIIITLNLNVALPSIFYCFLFNYYYLKLECRPAIHFLLFSF